MINKLKLKNFKCFKDIDISQNYLNVYSGLNSSGKSTTIQSLLLLKQSIQQGYFPKNINLNGDYICIGTGHDLLCEYAEDDNIGISFTDDQNQTYSLLVGYDEKADILPIINVNPDITNFFNVGFEYLDAERSSPQVIYPKSSYFIESMSQLGSHGEYAAHYLTRFQDNKLPWDSCAGKEQTLKCAVQYWLNEISPNINLNP